VVQSTWVRAEDAACLVDGDGIGHLAIEEVDLGSISMMMTFVYTMENNDLFPEEALIFRGPEQQSGHQQGRRGQRKQQQRLS